MKDLSEIVEGIYSQKLTENDLKAEVVRRVRVLFEKHNEKEFQKYFQSTWMGKVGEEQLLLYSSSQLLKCIQQAMKQASNEIKLLKHSSSCSYVG